MVTTSEVPPSNAHFPFLMRMTHVTRHTGLSRATIYRLMKDGQFPQNFLIGKSAKAWKDSDIRSWIDERASAPMVH